jgi:hypothetical protein
MALLLAGFAYVLFELPDDLVSPDNLTTKDWIELKNEVRTTGVQVLGGVILGLGAFFTAWNAFRTWRVTREGQLTEGFLKAVALLASDDVDARLGGVYALGRLARGAPQEHRAAMQVLTAFLRRSAPWPANAAAPDRPASDVQAAARVIGRRTAKYDRGNRLDLSAVDLRLVPLTRACLNHANLTESNLAGAFLDGADLKDANLTRADLSGARATKANLKRATLSGSTLIGTFLDKADLRGATLDDATIDGANFKGARGANLSSAVGQPGRSP